MSGLVCLGLALGALLAAAGFGTARAQSIGYTVQVVAVSDREAALALIADLDGYPAYTVRATTGVGDVYRVRVGAFANRAAAERYAAALPSIGGSAPVPALAENIPTPLMPLQAALLGTAKAESEVWDVVAWGGSVALRTAPSGGGDVPTWVAVTERGSIRFQAWRAAPADDTQTMVRVRDLPLWPATYDDLSEEARRAARASTVAQLARSLGLSEAEVDAAARLDGAGVPVVVVLERVRIDAVERVGRHGLAEVVGLAEPPAAGSAPDRWIAAQVAVPGASPTRLPLEPAAVVARGAVPVTGDGWSADSDGRFVRVETEAPDDATAPVSWRAAVGTPLWASGDLLLVRDRDEVVLYRLLPR